MEFYKFLSLNSIKEFGISLESLHFLTFSAKCWVTLSKDLLYPNQNWEALLFSPLLMITSLMIHVNISTLKCMFMFDSLWDELMYLSPISTRDQYEHLESILTPIQ